MIRASPRPAALPHTARVRPRQCDDGWARSNIWAQPQALPLPKGEGWGEGEQHAQIRPGTKSGRTPRWMLSKMESLGGSNISFPLTPALSLGERVERRQCDDGWSRSDIWAQPQALPLPKGEGWGEGELHAQ